MNYLNYVKLYWAHAILALLIIFSGYQWWEMRQIVTVVNNQGIALTQVINFLQQVTKAPAK